MRYSGHLLAALLALSLLTGCTTSKVKEASGAVAGGLFEMALDIALDGPERRADERRRCEDNPANRWGGCVSPWDVGYDRPTQAEREEEARRKRLAETAEYEAGIDEIIQALDAAEQRSGPPPPETTATDYERLQHRDETLEDWAEFDEFMRALETAEERNSDPRLTRITGK